MLYTLDFSLDVVPHSRFWLFFILNIDIVFPSPRPHQVPAFLGFPAKFSLYILCHFVILYLQQNCFRIVLWDLKTNQVAFLSHLFFVELLLFLFRLRVPMPMPTSVSSSPWSTWTNIDQWEASIKSINQWEESMSIVLTNEKKVRVLY